jgi:hypothetical protein
MHSARPGRGKAAGGAPGDRMGWESITLATVGFGLYCFALILKSTGLRHLRFAKVVDLSAPEQSDASKRTWMFAGALLLSVALMGTALWQSLDADRGTFGLLAILGAMLVGIRLLGFFFTRVSLVVLEIESDPASKLSLAHLWHSPLIRGGVALMLVSLVPIGFDRWVLARLDAWDGAQRTAVEARAQREGFHERYQPRFVRMGGRGYNEAAFFENVLIPGKRIVIEGRAGVGKTWFLTKLRFDAWRRHPGQRVVFLPAADLAPGEDIVAHIVRTALGARIHGARPAIAAALADALVLIDGLDEVHAGARREAIDAIGRLVADERLGRSIVIVTTRPMYLDPLLNAEEHRFELVELLPLLAGESERELQPTATRIAKLTGTLRARFGVDRPADARALALFHRGPVPAWPQLAPAQTARLFDAFLTAAGFKVPLASRDGAVAYLPFLSTFRDIDIAGELFVRTLGGDIGLPPGARVEQLRERLIDAFVRRRIELNYPLGTRNPALVARVIDELALQCEQALQRTPKAAELVLSRRNFQGTMFEGTTLEEAVLESELLEAEEDSDRMRFNNPAIEQHFRQRALRAGTAAR